MQTTVSFNSMLFHGDTPATGLHPRRARDFPFYGKLELTPQRAPAPGEIWLSRQAMQLLGAKVGRHSRSATPG